MPFKNPHPLYSVWQGMLRRCDNPNHRQWKDYGGRGITVCDRWKEPRTGFRNFIADMGERPDGCSLDRINNDSNYEPRNCRWATKKQQQRNQCVTRRVKIGGRTFKAVELADWSGLKTDTIVHRAKAGLPLEEVIAPERRVDTSGLALGGPANGARQRAKKRCRNGHPYTRKNTLITKEGWRACRKCHAARQNVRNAALRGAKKAPGQFRGIFLNLQ